MALETKQAPGHNIGSDIDAFSKLLELFKGKSGSTSESSTTTEGTQMSKEGVDALIRQILESANGLAAVSSGQKAAGLYNSTVQTQLANDLMSRTAGEVAKVTAPKVSSTSGTRVNQTAPQVGGYDIGKALIGLGASQITGPIIKRGMKKAGVDDLGTKIADAIFGTSVDFSNVASYANPATNFAGSMVGESPDIQEAFFGSSIADVGTDSSFSASEGVNSLTGDIAVDSALSFGADAGADFATDVFSNMATSEADVMFADAMLEDAGSAAAADGVPYFAIADIASHALGINEISEPIDSVKEGVGEVVGGIQDFGSDTISIIGDVGDAFSDVTDGCFITTAVCKYQNKPDDCEELTTLRQFRDTFMQETEYRQGLVEQYYIEAPEIVDTFSQLPPNLRATTYNSLYSDFIEPAVAAIKSGEYEVAYTLYVALFTRAKQIAGSV